MKKKFLLIAIMAIPFLSSCNNKDKKEDNQEFSYPYADVEQSKTQLQSSGQQLVDEMSSFADTEEKGIDALTNFSSLVSTSSLVGMENFAISTVARLNTATTNPQPDKIFHAMSSTPAISEIWSAMTGIYTWNRVKQDWDVTASTTAFEFHYPATKTGTTNNAVYTVTYKGTKDTYDMGDYVGDLPASITFSLKVDGTEYFSYNYAAAYASTGIPSSLQISVAFRSFVFAYSLTNNDSQVGLNYSFKDGSKVIIDLGLSCNGKFTEENLSSDPEFDQIVSAANAHVQLFNVKVSGLMDVAKISQAQKTLYANEKQSNFDKVKADTLFVKEINNDAKLVAYFTDTQKKIADVVAYAKPVSIYVYNGQSVVQKQSSEISFLFKFADNSTIDEFVNTGFDSLLTSLGSLAEDINSKFGTDIPLE